MKTFTWKAAKQIHATISQSVSNVSMLITDTPIQRLSKSNSQSSANIFLTTHIFVYTRIPTTTVVRTSCKIASPGWLKLCGFSKFGTTPFGGARAGALIIALIFAWSMAALTSLR